MAKFVVVEGNHLDPNDIKSLLPETKVIHGPFIKEEDADKLAKKLIQKNIDNYYHRAWVIRS
ncbi:MAG: hypothetical protein FF85_04860 [alpha proteobacterium QL1]|jgi:hypothetical protein|nr:MAG: hypothetical protein FF85_04860 [alpha proteobacterium QL1]